MNQNTEKKSRKCIWIYAVYKGLTILFRSECVNFSNAGRWNISAFGDNTMPADALAPKVIKASAGMILAVQDRQYALLFQI